ncbi:MAG: class I SAM-dependent methyltransferase [Thermodesulfobacteriota bacterium]|nr:class I SAM-dependent methyltransferase [Thermodesulfobacteriota bacterium]
MPDYYQKNFKTYHQKTFSIDPSSFLEPLAQRLPAEAFILDVGCGSGRDLLWMKKRGFDVIGFERSPGLAELARDNAACEVIEGDFETYDFDSILVDGMMTIGALVHVPHERFSEEYYNLRGVPQVPVRKSLSDRSIFTPDEQKFWPEQDNLHWHRKNLFRR